jgi:hypothetical protein
MLATRGIAPRCGILHAFLLPQWLKPQHFPWPQRAFEYRINHNIFKDLGVVASVIVFYYILGLFIG